MSQVWSWILTGIGLPCYLLVGRRIWWAWWPLLAGQAVWAVYSVVTEQWGFLVSVFAYSAIYAQNAKQWTQERKAQASEAR